MERNHPCYGQKQESICLYRHVAPGNKDCNSSFRCNPLYVQSEAPRVFTLGYVAYPTLGHIPVMMQFEAADKT